MINHPSATTHPLAPGTNVAIVGARPSGRFIFEGRARVVSGLYAARHLYLVQFAGESGEPKIRFVHPALQHNPSGLVAALQLLWASGLSPEITTTFDFLHSLPMERSGRSTRARKEAHR